MSQLILQQAHTDVMSFIISMGPPGSKQTDKKTRKLIRSHVMMGKNLGRTLPKRSTKHKTQEFKSGSKSCSGGPEEESNAHHKRDTRALSLSVSAQKAPTQVTGTSLQTVLSGTGIPANVGTDLSLIRFADSTVEPANVMVVLRFSAIAKQSLYPLEPCVQFDKPDRRWLEPLASDAVLLHTLISVTSDFLALMTASAQPANGFTARLTGREGGYFPKALRLLRERLTHPDKSDALSDDTICAVLCLATHARLVGDHEAGLFHMAGLRKMVTLRGGIANLRHFAKMLIDLLRCDLGTSLDTGAPPKYFQDPLAEPYFPFPSTPLSSLFPSSLLSTLHPQPSIVPPAFLTLISEPLSVAWTAVSSFSTAINTASVLKTKLPKEYLLDTMASVMYRLIAMGRDGGLGGLDELVRCGLLVFSTNVFLQWVNVRLPFEYLPRFYRGCFVAGQGWAGGVLKGRPEGCDERLWVWLLMVGGISVFDLDGVGPGVVKGRKVDMEWFGECLRGALEDCGIVMGMDGEQRDDWEEVKKLLGGFMWIDMLHDRAGRRVYETVKARVRAERDLEV